MKRLKYRECIKRFLAVAMLMLIAVNPVFTSINPAYGSGEISGEKNESELLTDETSPDILEQRFIMMQQMNGWKTFLENLLKERVFMRHVMN